MCLVNRNPWVVFPKKSSSYSSLTLGKLSSLFSVTLSIPLQSSHPLRLSHLAGAPFSWLKTFSSLPNSYMIFVISVYIYFRGGQIFDGLTLWPDITSTTPPNSETHTILDFVITINYTTVAMLSAKFYSLVALLPLSAITKHVAASIWLLIHYP